MRWLVLVTVVSFGKFYAHELVLGQVNLLFAVVAIGGAAGDARRGAKRSAGGARRRSRSSIKPYAVLFLPWLVARRQLAVDRHGARRASPLVLLLPALVYGWDGNIDAAPRMVADGHGNHGAEPLGVRQRLAGGDVLPLGRAGRCCRRALAFATAASCWRVAGAVFLWRRGVQRFRKALEGALLLTLMPLLSPQGWDYVFLIATPAIVFLVERRRPAAAAAARR